jgi:hypothetical protein
MSHFTVAVFTKEGQTVEELLAPYQENNMGDCPKQYLKFHDIEEKYKDKFENDTRKEFYCESSSSWGQQVSESVYKILKNTQVGKKAALVINKNSVGCGYFKKDHTYRCYYNEKHECPKEHIWIKVIDTVHFEGDIIVEVINPPKEISFKEYYNNDFEYFMKEWAGYERNEEGKYGYWENPNAKWDWYQIGGRWSGLLKLKNNAESGEYGKRSWTNKNTIISGNKADSAKIKDIDFSIDKKEYVESLRFWELVVEGDTPKNTEEKRIIENNFYKPEYYSNRYDNKEEYARLSSEFSTYAVITPDGIWHSKGEMGWWACGSETDEEAKAWNKSFKKRFINTADPEWILTVVDCHI